MFRLSSAIGLASLCCLASACSQPASNPNPAPSAQSAAPAAPAGPASAAVASLPAPYNTGDPDNGHARFAVCQACHTITAGGPNMTGPNLHGVLGRKAGTQPGFSYSDAMKAASWTWDAQHLDTWLAGPSKLVPGTKMTFVGLPNAQDRIDVIAYLATGGS